MKKFLTALTSIAALGLVALLVMPTYAAKPEKANGPKPEVLMGNHKQQQGQPEETPKGPDGKVDVCHQTEGVNEYILINVSENALASHLAHGDYLPGETYPEDETKKFAEDCSIVDKEWVLLETVEVPANLASNTLSVNSLVLGTDYVLKARGTAMACNQPGCVITFDAEYSASDLGSTWVDGVASPYAIYGVDLLDLTADGGVVDWGTYDISHEYELPYLGTGNPLSLFVNDLAGSHFNNSGSLFVDIYELQ